MSRSAAFVTLALFALFPAAASAHPADAAHAHGLVDGLLHPLIGVDHLAAMLGVGLWATFQRSVGAWVVPGGFVVGMSAGLLFAGMLPLAVGADAGVVLSLIVLGGLLACAVRLPVWAGIVIAMMAGAYHGAAHGSEAPGDFIGFAAGALAMTAVLHAAGAVAGATLRSHLIWMGRAAGIVLGAIGLGMTLQAM